MKCVDVMSGSLQFAPILDIDFMNLQMHQSIDTLRPEEAKKLNDFINRTHKSITMISAQIQEGEKHIALCNQAIKNVEAPIARGRKLLETYQMNLEALINIQERAKLLYPPIASTVETKHELDAELETSSSAYFALSSSIQDEQVLLLRRNISSMEDRMKRLEQELAGHQVTRRLADSVHQSLLACRAALEEALTEAQKALTPICRIPAEVWSKVFRLAVYGELHDYMATPTTLPHRNTIMELSLVCRFWRSIAEEEPILWTLVWIPDQNLSEAESIYLSQVIEKSRSSLTLISNPFTSRGKKPNAEIVNYNSLLYSMGHSLQINVSSTDGDVYSRPSLLFQRSLSVSIALHEHIPGIYSDFISQFSTTEALSITSSLQYGRSSDPLTVKPPAQLKNLKLFFNNFPNYLPFESFLVSTLQECHITHESREGLPHLTSQINLPNLKVLGISFPSEDFLRQVQMPALNTLIYYYPTGSGPYFYHGSLEEKAARKLARLENLVLYGWYQDRATYSSQGAEYVFASIAGEAWSLKTVKFEESLVNGEVLIQMVTGEWDEDQAYTMSRLEEITLSHTTGVTRDQCDRLKAVVKKLTIYV